jgi:hypothetical protein
MLFETLYFEIARYDRTQFTDRPFISPQRAVDLSGRAGTILIGFGIRRGISSYCDIFSRCILIITS